jgi:hypothetical protein
MSDSVDPTWLAKENNLVNHLVWISRLMNKCDSEGDLLNKEEFTKSLIDNIRREQALIGQVYVKYLGGSKRLHRSCSEDVVKQWLDYVEQSAAFWKRWEWKCYWL